MIWLISNQAALIQAITTLLPAAYPLKHLSTPEEMEPELSRVDDSIAPPLILLDVAGNPELIAACRQKSTDDLPIIALIARPEERQPALAAGADDYLLLPLVADELQRRVELYGNPAFQGLNSIIEITDQKQELLSPETLNHILEKLAEIFKASAAWLILPNSITQKFSLGGHYNFPEALSRNEAGLEREMAACLAEFQEEIGNGLYEINLRPVTPSNRPALSPLTHHLSIPLTNRQGFAGLLNLSYSSAPALSAFKRQGLLKLGGSLGRLLEMFQSQEENQRQAMQNAFIVLAARMISERLDLNTALSLTLELTIPLLGASAGDIWLFSENKDRLELASSLSHSFFKRKNLQRRPGEGLIGWAAVYDKPLYIPVAAQDAHFDPKVDRLGKSTGYSLLAVPLRHHETTIGFLLAYDEKIRPFASHDLVLLEGVAALTASAVVNARLMGELQAYAEQQRILYELSQQIGAGLNLKATFERALHWLSRLTEVEVILLWLLEEPAEAGATYAAKKRGKARYRLAAHLGLELSQPEPIFASPQSLTWWVAQHTRVALVNDPANDPRINPVLVQKLKLPLKNIVALPIVYQGQVIGVISLINKKNGFFQDNELPLLFTATEIIGAAVGNARLYARTVQLMEERERLHLEVIQGERLATVGRLTAVLSHEINNPMQAIQGALMLAMESLDELSESSEELANYITLSLNESERVVQLVGQMRQIYNPQVETPRPLQVNDLLQAAIQTAEKALKRQKVTLQTELAKNLPLVRGMANQLHLIFLSLLLNMSDRLGGDGGKIQLRTQATASLVQTMLVATPGSAVPGNLPGSLETETRQANLSFGLFMREEIIQAHQGRINLDYQNGQIICKIELPAINSGDEPALVPKKKTL